jgi:uncharacterized protein involved in response to NO
VNTPLFDFSRNPLTAPLFAAPHRLLFLVGALNVLAAMTWWLLWTAALRWQWWSMPQPPVPLPAGWAHGLVMSYQVFTPFIFGFLLTVFPRWTGQPALDRWHYVPVGLGLLGGQLLTLIGLCGFPQVLHVGLFATVIGWLSGLVSLATVLRSARQRDWHANACLIALAAGLTGLLLFIAWWHAPARGLLAFAALKIGIIGFLLPVYLTVAHRMLPFFAGNVVPDYRPWKPLWLLAALGLFLAVHLSLELAHAYAWLWLPDIALTIVSCAWLWRIWPTSDDQRTRLPGLLLVLFIALCWLPMAFALYSAQSLLFVATGDFLLGRAPVHALAIGLFGSLLVAMVTRVTMGHSGRPLAMSWIAWFAFLVVQVAAVLRIGAELVNDAWAWHTLAALAWITAFLPWVIRNAGIYLRPRADGQPG